MPRPVAILTAEQLSGYDTVYFGFPVWWSDYLSIRGDKVADSKQEVVDWVAKVSK